MATLASFEIKLFDGKVQSNRESQAFKDFLDTQPDGVSYFEIHDKPSLPKWLLPFHARAHGDFGHIAKRFDYNLSSGDVKAYAKSMWPEYMYLGEKENPLTGKTKEEWRSCRDIESESLYREWIEKYRYEFSRRYEKGDGLQIAYKEIIGSPSFQWYNGGYYQAEHYAEQI